MSGDIEAARRLLESSGYVVLKEASYRKAQERQRIAEVQRAAAERDRDNAERWARGCLDQERSIRDRLTELVEFAYQHGVTPGDLSTFNARLDADKAAANALTPTPEESL